MDNTRMCYDDPFLLDVAVELCEADENHATMNSLHEAYAVLLEEVDELWDEVRKKRRDRDPRRVRAELVQIAAMAWRTARDLIDMEPRAAKVLGEGVIC